MKAAGITEFGGPEVLQILDLPIPVPTKGQIRVRVTAATVNPVDTLIRRGLAFVSDATPPYVPGMEAAGVVDQIGEGTDTDLRVGDRVMAIAVVSGTRGAYAEFLVVPAASVVLAPDGATDVEIATLPMNGLTARMAIDLLKLPTGGTVAVAVVGAAGAVGGYAVQLAKADGFRVIADAAPKDVELVEALGADVVLPRGDGFAARVREQTPTGVDGLIDTAGIAPALALAVRDGGRIVTSAPGAPLVTERGIVTERTFVPDYARNHAALERLRDLVGQGRLTLRVARTLPIEQAAQAHRLLEAGGLRGRIVLTF
jgi:NADPH:quinone reductase-like Zn-dependent oxidoreductase